MKDEKFIKSIIKDGNVNLKRRTKLGVIIPYNQKDYNRIKELMEQINEKALKQIYPFKVSMDEDLEEGEVRFRYI